jgi:hypothetical protein
MDLSNEELLKRCECAASVDEIPQVGAGGLSLLIAFTLRLIRGLRHGREFNEQQGLPVVCSLNTMLGQRSQVKFLVILATPYMMVS